MSGSKIILAAKLSVVAGLLGGVVIVPLLRGHATMSGPSDTTSTTSSFGSKKFCLAQAAELHREYPYIYATDQQAYDGCRDAGTLIKQLRGHVDPSTRP